MKKIKKKKITARTYSGGGAGFVGWHGTLP